MAKRDYTVKALEIINAGSAIKSKIKEATDDLNRAYSERREVIMNACLDSFREDRANGKTEGEIHATAASVCYWGMPDLHNFKEKHVALIVAAFADAQAETVAAINDIVAMRAAVKSVEVVAREVKEAGPEALVKARVMKSFEALTAERKAVFNWAVEIVRELNKELPEVEKMPVHVSHVYCRNSWGTSWLRLDWYFNGRKTPFNVIAAAAQKVEDEKRK